MRKFTFLADYKGGTFISQYIANDVVAAEFLWAVNLDPQYFNEKERKKILAQIEEGEFKPISITGVDNVWNDIFLIFRKPLFLNIVETV